MEAGFVSSIPSNRGSQQGVQLAFADPRARRIALDTLAKLSEDLKAAQQSNRDREGRVGGLPNNETTALERLLVQDEDERIATALNWIEQQREDWIRQAPLPIPPSRGSSVPMARGGSSVPMARGGSPAPIARGHGVKRAVGGASSSKPIAGRDHPARGGTGRGRGLFGVPPPARNPTKLAPNRQPPSRVASPAQSAATDEEMTSIPYLLARGKQDRENGVPLWVCWYLTAAKNGSPEGQFELSQSYLDGIGSPAKPKEGIKWLTKAAKSGWPAAVDQLAKRLWSGKNVAQSRKSAADWYSKLSEGDPDFECCIGRAFLEGDGVLRDENQAVAWLERAIEHRSREAHVLLNRLRPSSLATGREDLQRDAEAGHPAACAAWGKHLVFNHREADAVSFFASGVRVGDAECQYQLALCYQNGKGTLSDLNCAKQLYEQAAAQNHVNAVFSLAWCYDRGKGTPKDRQKAYDLYLRANELGHPKALDRMNQMVGCKR